MGPRGTFWMPPGREDRHRWVGLRGVDGATPKFGKARTMAEGVFASVVASLMAKGPQMTDSTPRSVAVAVITNAAPLDQLINGRRAEVHHRPEFHQPPSGDLVPAVCLQAQPNEAVPEFVA